MTLTKKYFQKRNRNNCQGICTGTRTIFKSGVRSIYEALKIFLRENSMELSAKVSVGGAQRPGAVPSCCVGAQRPFEPVGVAYRREAPNISGKWWREAPRYNQSLLLYRRRKKPYVRALFTDGGVAPIDTIHPVWGLFCRF